MTHMTPQDLEILRIRNPHVVPDGEPTTNEAEEIESKLQAKCTKWLREHGWKYIHVQGKKNRAGILDLYVFLPKDHVVVFELKSKTGRMKDEQKEWVSYLAYHRYSVYPGVKSYKRFLEIMAKELTPYNQTLNKMEI